VMQLRGRLGTLEGGLVEKLQSRDSSVEITAGDPPFDQVQLITSEVLGIGGIRKNDPETE
jgi:hypothetical protein